jgi:hypothetical protein
LIGIIRAFKRHLEVEIEENIYVKFVINLAILYRDIGYGCNGFLKSPNCLKQELMAIPDFNGDKDCIDPSE